MSSTSRKRKRKNNIKIPCHIFQNESLEVVASIAGPIITAPVTAIDKDILLERFKIELLDRCSFFTQRTDIQDRSKDVSIEEKRSEILHRLLIVGTNECTRALAVTKKKYKNGTDTNSQNHLKPSLIMLARDVRPPTILAHIPFLCKQLDVPVVLLPGKASSDLGKLLQRRRAAVILFCVQDEDFLDSCNEVEKDVCHKIKSFVNFARSKIPSSFEKNEK